MHAPRASGEHVPHVARAHLGGGRDEHLYLKMPLAFLKAMPDPRFNWTYWTEPEPHLDGRRMPLPRGRVIGGSGLYEIPGLADRRWERVESPWGAPSDDILFGELSGVPAVLRSR